jgi:hypothetical protein
MRTRWILALAALAFAVTSISGCKEVGKFAVRKVTSKVAARESSEHTAREVAEGVGRKIAGRSGREIVERVAVTQLPRERDRGREHPRPSGWRLGGSTTPPQSFPTPSWDVSPKVPAVVPEVEALRQLQQPDHLRAQREMEWQQQQWHQLQLQRAQYPR